MKKCRTGFRSKISLTSKKVENEILAKRSGTKKLTRHPTDESDKGFKSRTIDFVMKIVTLVQFSSNSKSLILKDGRKCWKERLLIT